MTDGPGNGEDAENNGEFDGPTPEELKYTAAETAKRYAEAVFFSVSSFNWEKPTSQNVWIAHHGIVPWTRKVEDPIVGLSLYLVQTKFLKFHNPVELLEGQLDSTEWALRTSDPLFGMNFDPVKGLRILRDGREASFEQSNLDEWEDMTEHLGRVIDYMGGERPLD
ncbi:MAG: hypothetical protein R3313_00480 [Candidatus Saccharimonadales bacterium]|nr:hypothetical protein [Candidatus Saccharimonadales bacterium]